MSQQDLFNRILASLYEAMLDDTHWPATSIVMVCSVVVFCAAGGL